MSPQGPPKGDSAEIRIKEGQAMMEAEGSGIRGGRGHAAGSLKMEGESANRTHTCVAIGTFEFLCVAFIIDFY